MKKLLLLALFIPFVCLGQLQFLPKSQGEIIEHTYYSLSYDEKHEQAEWVHYRLNSIMLKGKEKRENYRFKQDMTFLTKSVKYSDYTNFGYDRGHLAPFADMKMDSTSASESFYMSNISPQKPKFNQGVWKRLEKHVRSLAEKNELYITTGGVLNSDLKRIGKENNISVPKQFYKIIYDAKNKKMTAYLMPNIKLDSFEKHAVTVDSIEVLTGIDFYPQLPDKLEEELESALDN